MLPTSWHFSKPKRLCLFDPMDIVDEATRGKMMSAISGKNTKPELVVRKGLHALGFRFRIHRRDLPGTPDIVLPKYSAIINVNGCFWHGHGCYLFKVPKTHQRFWLDKIQSNIRRDQENQQRLLDAGWRVCLIWECALRGKAHKDQLPVLLAAVSRWLRGNERFVQFAGGRSNADTPVYSFSIEGEPAAERSISNYSPRPQ